MRETLSLRNHDCGFRFENFETNLDITLGLVKG